MTEPETAALPEGDTAAPPPAAPEGASSEPPRAPRHAILGWLCLLGFLILAAAIALSWFYPRTALVSDKAELAALNGRIEHQALQLAATETKLAALAAAATKLARAEAARPGAPDLASIEARLAALEKRKPPAPDLGSIEARLAALENRKPPAAAPPTPAELAASLAPLSKRLDSLENSEADLVKRVDGIAMQLDEIAKRSERSERMTRLAAAAVALEQGRPLGSLPGAPPPLAHFASIAPPTLAALRLSFPPAAAAERSAARTAEPAQSLVQRMKDRLGDLLTLREGNKVIVGNPAEPALADAQSALDAGDLEAAVAALGSLPAPLAAPLRQWKDQATALLAAERALSSLASAD